MFQKWRFGKKQLGKANGKNNEYKSYQEAVQRFYDLDTGHLLHMPCGNGRIGLDAIKNTKSEENEGIEEGKQDHQKDGEV